MQCHTFAALLISLLVIDLLGHLTFNFRQILFVESLAWRWRVLWPPPQVLVHRSQCLRWVSVCFIFQMCKSWTWADKASDKRHRALKEIIWAQTISTMHIPDGKGCKGCHWENTYAYKCYAPKKSHFNLVRFISSHLSSVRPRRHTAIHRLWQFLLLVPCIWYICII